MKLIHLAYRQLVHRPLSSLLSVVLLAFGVALVTVVLLGTAQLQTMAEKQVKGVDLVVAAKGSPLQSILCNVFHLDFPTGNIGLLEAEKMTKNRLVKRAIPLSIGDSYRGSRIVGTTSKIFDLYDSEAAAGTKEISSGLIVAGATVAQQLNLQVGDHVVSTHGLAEVGASHDDNALKISGILEPTGLPIDRLLLTSLKTVWDAHGEKSDTSTTEIVEIFGVPMQQHLAEERQVTSLLVKFASPMAAVRLPRWINEQTNMQAASPAFEMARIVSISEDLISLAYAFGGFVIVLAAISVLISLMNAVKERKYELAIMRVNGASKVQLVGVLLIEVFILIICGSGLGLMIGHMSIEVAGRTFELNGMTGYNILPVEGVVVLVSFAIALTASILPIWMVYRVDMAKTLAES